MTQASLARTLLAPVVFGLLFIALWQALVTGLEIKAAVVPAPFAIGNEFVEKFPTVLKGALVTGANALVGLVVGFVAGVVLAAVAALTRVFDEIVAPVIAGLAVIPIVAVAPVFYAMFGANAETPRQLIAAIAVFIPVYINMLRGLRQVRPVHRDLLRAYAASSWQVTRTVTLPGALPYLFTGLRIASSLAVISALVAEYFGGPVSGLGRSITSAAASSNYPLAWAYVLGAILLGLVFYAAMLGLEKLGSRHSRAQ